MQFLEPEQSLADIATFITFLHQEYDTFYAGNTVVVYGSGYGGTMAVWARKKFPHLIDGAWSSSGLYQVSLNSFSKMTLAARFWDIFLKRLLQCV